MARDTTEYRAEDTCCIITKILNELIEKKSESKLICTASLGGVYGGRWQRVYFNYVFKPDYEMIILDDISSVSEYAHVSVRGYIIHIDNESFLEMNDLITDYISMNLFLVSHYGERFEFVNEIDYKQIITASDILQMIRIKEKKENELYKKEKQLRQLAREITFKADKFRYDLDDFMKVIGRMSKLKNGIDIARFVKGDYEDEYLKALRAVKLIKRFDKHNTEINKTITEILDL